ncbi:amino acid--[acyl-carrier-protein] ligase [Lichenibacterium ramalinae]|uniref:Amino acid--[acyl-carrier-protein] ligase n=1 Tax=Lichenibacterium ramalinae TaxID=2316527 RepID=A0A4V1RI59_9HYPH|nr:amino acid--[acyl-carrier-protein] ligase [Lichenibacterium ramalinae]RYB02433.1 amino acid--[acyl-carrier-protein] ligase [Lichenibacterium ramalinae]
MNAPFRTEASFQEVDDRLTSLMDALFHPTGVPGVYGRKGVYEGVVERLAAFISEAREDGTEVLRFPPVMSRRTLERSGYLKSFPNLLGCMCALGGSDDDIRAAVDTFESGGDWTEALEAGDLVLTPAACYPVYPIAARRGPLPAGGLRFDVASDCFRREPSHHADRFQSFRMREYVCIGSAADVSAFRDRWMERAKGLADRLGLSYTVDQANDPFFGKVGVMMAVMQKRDALKFELLVPVRSAEKPTACMSFNNHKEHFGEVWGLRDAEGEVAHTGCVAFGMDRLAVALFATHGVDPAAWPAAVRDALRL